MSHSSWSGKGMSSQVKVSQPQQPNPSRRSGILEAVQGKKLDVVQRLVEQNPDVVNEKGFAGLQPLHKAALHGDPSVVEYLLQHNANPNATNDFEETPLHFACKRGNPIVVKHLINGGADMRGEDKAGRGPMHHAALGGSVLVTQYLSTVLGASTHVRDKNMNTPLHLVSSLGHTELLKYLLKKERSDVFAEDCGGNTALHIAASYGHGWSCWRLLVTGGLRLLHVTNRDGLKPVEMSPVQGGQAKFKETNAVLTQYTGLPPQYQGTLGPSLAWYFLLFCAPVFYPLLLLIAHLTPWPGIAATIGFAILAFYLLNQQQHRIHHLCRWPNPVHVGMFAAGLFYTMISYFWLIFPDIYSERPVFALITVLLAVLLTYLYVQLIHVKDPGVCKQSVQKPSGGYYELEDLAAGALKMDAFCFDCEIIPPPRTHHCKLCDRCYYNLDHHCLFLYRCVAADNHRLFVTFITLCIINVSLFIYISITHILASYPSQPLDSHLLWTIFNDHTWQWTITVANIVSLFVGLSLLRYQMVVISKGLTTAYQPNYGRTSLKFSQRLLNLVRFAQGKQTYILDNTFTC